MFTRGTENVTQGELKHAHDVVILSDSAEDFEGGSQSFKVNIPPEFDDAELADYYVNRNGEWFKQGEPGRVVAVSTTIVRASPQFNVPAERIADLRVFYSLLDLLENRLGGTRILRKCAGIQGWPRRGVYFFMEDGERRSDSGSGLRIVRIGTHAITGSNSQTKLWTRLSQHRGPSQSGGGNHRGSIFRELVGTALIRRNGHAFPTWGEGNSAPADVRIGEVALESEVSSIIGEMPFLWLAADDDPGPSSLRAYIERNAIALLSNFRRPEVDPPSEGWLGRSCDRERVKESGLWNSQHVDECFDRVFLARLQDLVTHMKCAT